MLSDALQINAGFSTSALYHENAQRRAFLFWLVALVGLSGLVGFILFSGRNPDGSTNPAMIGWLIFWAGAIAILVRPRYGLYLTLFFTLVGDGLLIPWYPFNKNFSSGESIFFLGNALIFSPLELYLVLMTLGLAIHCFVRRKFDLRAGPLGLPMLIFPLAIMGGLGYGVVRGGSVNTALWECRPIFYLPLMYFLAVNLLENRRQINILAWAALLGNLAQGLIGDYHFLAVMGGSLAGADRIMEHASSIHINFLFVLAITAWLFQASWLKRILLPLLSLPVALAYLANQRRASFITLGVALVLIGLAFYRQNRRAFMMIAPIAAILAVGYLAAFWNSSGTLGLPASGIKSVFAPDESDASSNDYRVVENINTSFTIHQVPLMGVGFGNKFYIIVPLPDISFFEWWEYITHNSILWVWMKAGLYGFLAMVFMIGTTVAVGVRSYDRLAGDDYKAIGLAFTLYILMHFVYAYVDMSWDTQSMIFVGAAAGALGSLDRVMAIPVRQPPPRYPWQKPVPPQQVLPEDER